MKKVYLHGDVVLRQIENLPDGVKKVEKTKRGYILAIGESTGHYHAIQDDTTEMYEKDGILYLRIPKSTEVYHQEHLTMPKNVETEIPEKIEEGIYEIDFPQEYDHFKEEARRVHD